MVIKNREERSYAIWRFVGIAAALCSLVFFAGFTLGDTSKTVGMNYKKLYEEASGTGMSLGAKAQMLNAFSVRMAALMKLAEAKMNELDKDLTTAASVKDQQALIQWAANERDASAMFEDSSYQIKRDFKELGADLAMVNNIDFFNKYRTSVQRRLWKQRDDIKATLETGDQQKLDEVLKKIEAGNEAARAVGAQNQAQSDLNQLKADLADCKQKLAGGQTGQSNHKEIAKKAKTQIENVQQNMLPSISDSRFKNDSKKLNELKDKINTSLLITLSDLNGIQ